MKLATLKDGTRDGQLIVVSRDLHTAAIADAIAPTLQRVIEDWSFYAPQLQALYDALNTGRARRAFGFDASHCMAPLPRSYRVTGTDAVYRGDLLHGASDDIEIGNEVSGVRVEAGVAAILSDVPHGTPLARATDSIRLLMLSAVFSAVPASSGLAGDAAAMAYRRCGFSPVAVTPDELGEGWQAGQWAMPLDAQLNGRPLVPRPKSRRKSVNAEAPTEAAADFPNFSVPIASLARAHAIAAGTIVINVPGGDEEGENRGTAVEYGDRLRLDMLDAQGESLCGVLEQSVISTESTGA